MLKAKGEEGERGGARAGESGIWDGRSLYSSAVKSDLPGERSALQMMPAWKAPVC